MPAPLVDKSRMCQSLSHPPLRGAFCTNLCLRAPLKPSSPPLIEWVSSVTGTEFQNFNVALTSAIPERSIIMTLMCLNLPRRSRCGFDNHTVNPLVRHPVDIEWSTPADSKSVQSVPIIITFAYNAKEKHKKTTMSFAYFNIGFKKNVPSAHIFSIIRSFQYLILY